MFTEDKTLCDGSEAQSMSLLKCLIPMKQLRLNFGYGLQDLPQFIVRAANIRGFGAYSDANTVGGLI